MVNEPVKKESAQLQPWHNFATYVKDRAAIEAPIVADELGSAQMNALITAQTEEDLDAAMKMAGLTGLKDIADGTEIRITGFHYSPGNRGDFANRFGVFAVIEAIDLASGQKLALDTGVERIIVWLRAHELMTPENQDPWPCDRRVSKVQTSSGNEMITLLPLSKRLTD